MLTINSTMQRVFDALDVETYLPQAQIASALQKLAREQVFEIEGCFLLGVSVADGFTLAHALTIEPTRTLIEAAYSRGICDLEPAFAAATGSAREFDAGNPVCLRASAESRELRTLSYRANIRIAGINARL